MSVRTSLYTESNEVILVEVFVNGISVGVCQENAVDDMLYVLGYGR